MPQANLLPTTDLDFSAGAILAEINKVRNAVPGALALTVIAAGAVPPHTAANYLISAGSAQALTLAAPTVGTDDGLRISFKSSTLFAHTITATGLLGTGTAAVNVATFAAQAGAGLELMAQNGKWLVMSSVGITFS